MSDNENFVYSTSKDCSIIKCLISFFFFFSKKIISQIIEVIFINFFFQLGNLTTLRKEFKISGFNKKEKKDVKGHTDQILSISVSFDGKFLVIFFFFPKWFKH